MHVRMSASLGMPLVDDRSDELLATVTGIFLHPDVGTVLGFFVRTAVGEEFLSVEDIAHWGRAIVVRNADAIAPLEERVRLSQLWSEGRRILGQRIVTEQGIVLGRCADLQFETDTFRLEWLFPRTWFRWKRPLPAGAIIEVRPDAIYVREIQIPAASEEAARSPLEAITVAKAVQG